MTLNCSPLLVVYSRTLNSAFISSLAVGGDAAGMSIILDTGDVVRLFGNGDVGVSPAEQRRQTDCQRQRPDHGDGDLGAGRRHEQRISERSADGKVAVKTDRAQVEDRSRADPDVDGQPRAAPDPSERPPAEHLIDAAERQDDGSQEQVGDGQRHDECVGDRAQIAVGKDGGDDKAVADDDDQIECNQRGYWRDEAH